MKYFIGILIGIMLLYVIFRPSCGCERFTIYGLLSNDDACLRCTKPYEQKLKKLEKEWNIIEDKIKHIKHGRSYIVSFNNNTFRDNFREKLATILRIGIENIFIVKIEDKKIVFSFVSKESVLTDAEQKITELNNIFLVSFLISSTDG